MRSSFTKHKRHVEKYHTHHLQQACDSYDSHEYWTWLKTVSSDFQTPQSWLKKKKRKLGGASFLLTHLGVVGIRIKHSSIYYFSNALIIQKPKTKEIMHRDVFGYLMKKSSFLHPLFHLQNQFVWEVISNTRHSVSSQYQKPLSSSKILRYASYFQLSSRCLICVIHVSRVWYITWYQTSRLTHFWDSLKVIPLWQFCP